MTVGLRFLRRRWEQREREADQAEVVLAQAQDEHARVRELTAEARRLERDSFTEAIYASFYGVRHEPRRLRP